MGPAAPLVPTPAAPVVPVPEAVVLASSVGVEEPSGAWLVGSPQPVSTKTHKHRATRVEASTLSWLDQASEGAWKVRFTETGSGHTEQVEERRVQLVVRRSLILKKTARLELPGGLARQQIWQTAPIMDLALREFIGPEHEKVVEQRAVAFGNLLQLGQQVGKLLRVPSVDARETSGVGIDVMRHEMVFSGDVQLRMHDGALRRGPLQGHDTAQVARKRQNH